MYFVLANHEPQHLTESHQAFANAIETIKSLRKEIISGSGMEQRPNFNYLLAIQDPTDELAYANLEVETILPLFSPVEVLVKEKADEAALKANQTLSQAHCNHFSCHGEFNLESPLESALLLAKHGRLTLTEIFSLNLDQCRLVTLSACETGLSDPN
jgi:CHAT domain-containing protein